MEFGLQAIRGTYGEILTWVRWAEERGLAAFGLPDHFLASDPEKPMIDALSVAAGLARETESIELATLVSPVTWRHPAVLIKTYAALADMSEGRFVLGVGTGWMDREHDVFGIPFPAMSERFAMLDEALGYLRAAMADPPQAFAGEHYSFDGTAISPRPPLRLLVGGTGAVKTPKLAGRYADEFNAYPSPEPDFRPKIELARDEAVAAGRDPDALRISSSGVLVAGDTPEEYRRRLEQLAAYVDRDPDEVEASLIERNAPHGTWDQVRETLDQMERAGMSRFWIQAVFDEDDEMDQVERALERLRS